MKIRTHSSLSRIFKDGSPEQGGFSSFSVFKNEKFSYQLAVFPESDEETNINITVNSTLEECIRLYRVENIPAGKTRNSYSDDYHYPCGITEYPDLLRPINEEICLPKGEWSALLIELNLNAKHIDRHEIILNLQTEKNCFTESFALNIINCTLPGQRLIYTDWFHNDCLCTYYGIEIFSDAYWKIAENYIKNAAEYGVNMILTPIFTPPLDTAVGKERPTVQLVDVECSGDEVRFGFEKLGKYVALCRKYGIENFEISHLFTQWGALHPPKIMATVNGDYKQIFGWNDDASGEEYTAFLERFSIAFRKEVQTLGIKEKCRIHISDEPNSEQFEQYKKAAQTVNRLFGDFKSLDALSDIEYYKSGLVKTPVCAESEADIFRFEVKDFWTYYCCTQTNKYLPNRTFAQPSVRNRILGILLYKYRAEGFLHWGHNFWYSQYSDHPIDPFTVADADGAFPSGDSFVVYPGSNGKPLNSLRHLVFHDGLQDIRALELLESLTSREYVMNILEKDLTGPLSFTEYPHDEKWLLATREKINEEIAEAIKSR